MVGDRYRLPTLSIREQAEIDRLQLLRREQNLSWEDELDVTAGQRRSRRGGSRGRNSTAGRAAACTAGRH